nr:MAG TPA: hypothetical protein [Caudoviricetes sp.]
MGQSLKNFCHAFCHTAFEENRKKPKENSFIKQRTFAVEV